MLGKHPYKKPSPKSSNTEAPKPTVAGVPLPASLKVENSELIGLAESPEVAVPSTYDDALRNDELLDNIDLVGEQMIEIFPSGASKDEIAFGIPVSKETDSKAFGGSVGTAPTVEGASPTGAPVAPLTTEERTVVVQNSTIVSGFGATGAGESYELGTKLIGVAESQQKLQEILSTTVNLTDPDTEIIQVEEFDVPPSVDIIDGGDF